jgi:YVTN family beta-propeller protein
MSHNQTAHVWAGCRSIGNCWPGSEKIMRALALVLIVSALHPREASAAQTSGQKKGAKNEPPTLSTPSHSTTIALTSDDRFLVVVNREANSVSILQVRDEWGKDLSVKIAEIGVGREPRCVAISPDDREAFVTNAISGTVSVVSLQDLRVVSTIPVDTEPRGCALSPNGTFLYVANHTAGTVSVISTVARKVVGKAFVGRNPTALAVTNDGDKNDFDERVFVTQIFAELIPNGPGEGFNLGKRGVVQSFPVANPSAIKKITLSPLADSGFTSNRTNFCPKLNPNIHPPDVANPIFCPDPGADVANDAILKNPQGVYPNQFLSALITGNRLFLPNIGAQPEPVERLDTNVQALVYSVDTKALAEVATEHVNLNQQIATEPVPADPTKLDHLFGNDLVAIDASADGKEFLIVSRGGNYAIRASLDTGGKLDIHAPNDVVRFQTGNLPSGVTFSKKDGGKRAYANNEANFSVTAMNLQNNTVLNRDISSSEPPAPGDFEHSVLVGKVAFFTALGIADNGIFDTPIRDIIPANFRGKQSKDAWSSCGSCHPDGLADGVTWFFGTGPRQTKPLDGMFAKDSPSDQGLLNWSAVRGSNTDFNNNSRVTQGGCGFASDAFDLPGNCVALGNMAKANPAIYDHGITQGASDALDAQTLWIFAAVRPLLQPQPQNSGGLANGRAIFTKNCASCHGGAKWTKSQIFHRDNPAAIAQAMAPLDPGVVNRANEFRSFTCNKLTFNYLDDVGTFDVNNPIEIRDINGITALGADGFNSPSLLSTRYHAPYLHRGQAQTLAQVFPLHLLPATGQSITATLASQGASAANLLVFLNSIDGRTDHIRSDGDEFRDMLRAQGACPAQTTPMTTTTRVTKARSTSATQ